MAYLNPLMFDQIFFLPRVKQSVIISNKYGIYELSRVIPNDVTRKYFAHDCSTFILKTVYGKSLFSQGSMCKRSFFRTELLPKIQCKHYQITFHANITQMLAYIVRTSWKKLLKI